MRLQELKFLLLIIVVFIAACIETDIYLPAFPDMMAFFSVSEEMIQSLLTWNFIGICISGPLYGPISDSVGRKKPLMVALGLFLTGSIMTLSAQSFQHMLWGRLLQGLGSGGCFTLGTAIIFDVFHARKAIQAISQINSIVPFIMATAPMLGGYLNHVYGFRSNFFAIALFVLISFVVCIFFFAETLPKEKRRPLQAKKVMRDFMRAGSSLPFWQLTAVISLLFSAYITFLSGTAVLFVVEFGIPKESIPLYQSFLLVSWLIASLTCDRAITRWGIPKIKKVGTTLIAMGGLGFLLTALHAPQNPYFLTGAMAIYSFGANWTQGIYFPESMAILPDIKGITASLLTSARLLVTVVIVEATSLFYNGTIYPIAFAVVGVTIVILPALLVYERQNSFAGTESRSAEQGVVH